MKGAMGQIMRQAQEMQERMKRMQAEVAALEVTGEAGAGMVKVTLNGKHEARRVQIAPDMLGEDKEFIEDLIAAAINDAAHKLETVTHEKMSAVTGGMNLPPGMDLGNLGL